MYYLIPVQPVKPYRLQKTNVFYNN